MLNTKDVKGLNLIFQGASALPKMWKHELHLYNSHATDAPIASPQRKKAQYQKFGFFKKPKGLKSLGCASSVDIKPFFS